MRTTTAARTPTPASLDYTAPPVPGRQGRDHRGAVADRRPPHADRARDRRRWRSTVSPPFSVQARGPLNGANGGDGSRLVAGFPAKVFRGKGKKRHAVFVLRPSRTVSYGKGATIRGTLKGADGQPVTSGDVRILVRENRLGAQYVDRGGVTTGADGRFVFPVPAGSSRVLRLAYRAYLGDDAYATRSTSTLNTRARISVRGPSMCTGTGSRSSAVGSSGARSRRAASPSTCRSSSPASGGASSPTRGLAGVAPSRSVITSSARARDASPSGSACARRRLSVLARRKSTDARARGMIGALASTVMQGRVLGCSTYSWHEALALARPVLRTYGSLPGLGAVVVSAQRRQLHGVRAEAGWEPDVQHVREGWSRRLWTTAARRGLCSSLGPVRDNLAVGDYAGWRFDAPPDTTISKLAVAWRGRGDSPVGTGPRSRLASTRPQPRATDPSTRSIPRTRATSTPAGCASAGVLSHPAGVRTRLGTLTDTVPVPVDPTSTVTVLDRAAPIVQAAAAQPSPTPHGPGPSR